MSGLMVSKKSNLERYYECYFSRPVRLRARHIERYVYHIHSVDLVVDNPTDATGRRQWCQTRRMTPVLLEPGQCSTARVRHKV
jgi:hypothetical protein